MADNTILNAGTGGDTLASDDISGVKFPRIKLIHGADGTNDGDVSNANPLPVITKANTIDPNYRMAILTRWAIGKYKAML